MGRIVSTLDACWKAIDVWEPLKDSWERQFRKDEDLAALNMSGIGIGDIGDKAAITIKQQPFDIKPYATQALTWPIVMRVEIWKDDSEYRCTMNLLEEIVRAWFKATDGPGPTVLEAAACGPPVQILGMSVEFIQIPTGQQAQPDQNFPVVHGTAAVVFQGNFTL
jgi:hypothetical protein